MDSHVDSRMVTTDGRYALGGRRTPEPLRVSNGSHDRRRRTLSVVLALTLASGCASLPTGYEKTATAALTGTADTSLGAAVSRWTAEHDGQSGFYPLPAGLDALGARLALIDRAERSIDAQYFLIKDDSAGLIFAGKLVEAADRGVRVRFLLDDVFTTVADEDLLRLDEHPNIEIRLFNPIARGGISSLNFLLDFKTANRRMHNKSFTVDNQATIVGGRNIADEYFQLTADAEFVDFDMLGFGPVAAGVSTTFDRFWNHELAVPFSAFELSDERLPGLRAELDAAMRRMGDSIYRQAIAAPLVQDLLNRDATLFPADAEVITDDPDKLLNEVSREQQILITRMADVVAAASKEVIVSTPYFVPGDEGVAFWKGVVDSGVAVSIVTNSLASNNHIAVHSAYAGYRKKLLQAGVDLYEVRANAVADSTGDEGPDSLTLHTKAALIDGRYTFVGSLNLDPRSIDINTEMGVLVDAAALAEPLTERFKHRLPELTYKLELDERGRILWRATIDGKEVVETGEPLASGGRKLNAWVQKIAPESQM
jgi:putative cardiolipin synthase